MSDREFTLYLDTSGEPLFKRGRRVATGTAPANDGTGQARVWDVDSGQPVGRPMLHGRGVNQLRFSPPDGRKIAFASVRNGINVLQSNLEQGLAAFAKVGRELGVLK